MSLVFIESLDVQLSGKEILTDINLNIEKGGMTFLIGKTGSGKTTLIKSFYGDISINSSERFEIAGFNLKEIKDYQIPFLRRKIGIVFQDFKLLDDRSIYKNLEFVLKATEWKDKLKIDERINEVLNQVGMIDIKDRFPHQLSGGEQQRVSIARAILNKPDLILADEPTGNLDPATSKEIMNLLIDINNQGSTVLMATHDYDMISNFPKKTLRLEDGKLFELSKKT